MGNTRNKAAPGQVRGLQLLLEDSARHLSDTELLTLLLNSSAAAGRISPELAASGGITRLAAIVTRQRGLTAVQATRILAAIELGRRYLEAPARPGLPLTSPAGALGAFRARMVDLEHEAFACLYLDTRHRVIAFEMLFRGTVDGASVHPREVARRALHHNATALICGHNHPSGAATPSRADWQITSRLREALFLLDIRLLDHLVIGRDGWASMATLGWPGHCREGQESV